MPPEVLLAAAIPILQRLKGQFEEAALLRKPFRPAELAAAMRSSLDA